MNVYKTDTARYTDVLDKIKNTFGDVSLGKLLEIKSVLDNEVSLNAKAKVIFSSVAYMKMYALIDKCDKEIAWDGVVRRSEEDSATFIVEDILVYPQETTGATVNTDDKVFNDYVTALDDYTFNHRRFAGHSHVNMGTSPSTTDLKHREDTMRNVEDYFIYGIFNKKREFSMVIFDVENNITYDTKDIIMKLEFDDWAENEIKENVKPKTYANTYSNWDSARNVAAGIASSAAANRQPTFNSYTGKSYVQPNAYNNNKEKEDNLSYYEKMYEGYFD